jgi:hypothetical protein
MRTSVLLLLASVLLVPLAHAGKRSMAGAFPSLPLLSYTRGERIPV